MTRSVGLGTWVTHRQKMLEKLVGSNCWLCGVEISSKRTENKLVCDSCGEYRANRNLERFDVGDGIKV